MKIKISNVLTVSDASIEAMGWCKRALTINNPEFERRVKLGLWIGNTPQTIRLFKVVGTDLELPYGVLSYLPHRLTAQCRFTQVFEKPEKVDYNAYIDLFDYQERAVQAIMAKGLGILQSPPGTGKTQMGLAIVCRYGTRALWLTHTSDLLKQSKDRAEAYIDKKLIGTITSGKVDVGKGLTFATIQTMSRLNLEEYKYLWDVIIIDECHRVAGGPTVITQYYKVLNNLAARHKIGLSATVHRADGMIKATYALIGKVIHTVSPEEVKDRIVRIGVKPIETGIKVDPYCLNTDGTLNYSKLLQYLCNSPERDRVIVNCLIENKDYSCLILSERLSQLEDLMDLLPKDMWENAVMISGKMSASKAGREEREKNLEDMRTGRKKYLFATYALAKEGLDIPRLERLFLITPNKDYAIITQSIGRIARTFEGKADPIVYDFVDDMRYTVNSYKKRCSIYRKNDCYFVEDE